MLLSLAHSTHFVVNSCVTRSVTLSVTFRVTSSSISFLTLSEYLIVIPLILSIPTITIKHRKIENGIAFAKCSIVASESLVYETPSERNS